MKIKDQVIEEIKKIYDPEIPVNIYELGFIYDIDVDLKNNVKINMTLTSPNCPVAESLPKEVKDNIMKVEGVSDEVNSGRSRININVVTQTQNTSIFCCLFASGKLPFYPVK